MGRAKGFSPPLDPPLGARRGGAERAIFWWGERKSRARGSSGSVRRPSRERAVTSVSLMDHVMALLERSASPVGAAAGHAEYVYSFVDGATSPLGIAALSDFVGRMENMSHC